MIKQVLLIEDDDALRMSLAQTLNLDGIEVIQANGFVQARRSIRSNFPGVILSDIRMPYKSGFDVLEYTKSVDTDLPVVFITGEADVPMALRAMKNGAYDLLEKPCSTGHLQEVLNRAIAYRALIIQTRNLENAIKRNDAASMNFPGTSSAVKRLRKDLRRIAALPVHVHLYGRKGVGKKLAAHTIHTLSDNKNTFVGINFSDKANSRIAELDLRIDNKDISLKNIEHANPDQIIEILDLAKSHPTIRLIFSSVHSMDDLVIRGINKDISNLNIAHLKVPTLKERKQDLPIILENLMRQSARTLNTDMPQIPNDVYAEVLTKDWALNLSELRDFAQTLVMGLSVRNRQGNDLTLAHQMDGFEKLVLTETLKQYNGKVVDAAEALGLPRKTLYDHLSRFYIRPKDYKNR